jgi:hypothetical protein
LRQNCLVPFYASLLAGVKDDEMSVHSNFSSKTYHEAAIEFIQQIRQYSSSAADCIEQIQLQYGIRAAYLAAFALVDLKHRQVKHQYNPSSHDLHAFTYCDEMRETAEAIRLYEAAAAHLLPGYTDDGHSLL